MTTKQTVPLPPLADEDHNKVVPLRPPRLWHDPLGVMQNSAPSEPGRIVLWTISVLVLLLIIWATFSKIDIIVSAEGKLVPQTLLKIVQPSEPGVVRELLVNEGDSVKRGQVLARLDTTLATADQASVRGDLLTQKMQARAIEAELSSQPARRQAGDDRLVFAQVSQQFAARRKAQADMLEQERSLLQKVEHEYQSANATLLKLEQTLPIYREAASSLAALAKDGYIPSARSEEKRREEIERTKDIDAQRAAIAALVSGITAQKQKMTQLQSAYRSGLEKELSETRLRIGQLQPTLDKATYREGQMELHAPQDGVIKDLATTTIGAVVQPSSVVLTLIPNGEKLYADVYLKNADVGFVQVGQQAKIKLAAYPFQKYGMLSGVVQMVSADASAADGAGRSGDAGHRTAGEDNAVPNVAPYKARIQLKQQVLENPHGAALRTTAGMQVIVEIHQGQRTVLEYLLSPVKKTLSEAGRER